MSTEKKNNSGLPIDVVYGPNETKSSASEQPGQFPYTRGVKPDMYRGRLWTMRQYAGFSTAEASNERYHYLLNQGTTGLSVAFDLPTQIGYDSDHAMSEGEVGKVGVAIDSLADMEILFKGIQLQDVTTSMTINSTASTLLAMYVALAKKQGADLSKIGGTIQNDILKEYAARGTYIYPVRPSMRLITDIFEWCSKELPRWNTISISGYHIREAGSTAVQELAFTLANGKAYVEAAKKKGLDVNVFGKRLSFFFNAHNDFFEEAAKFRAARRIWANIMKSMGATNPDAMMLRFHTQTGGSTLTAQQPENNIARVTIQALSAVLGGTQSLHTNGYDEALNLPTEKAARIALRTQQIIAHESGAACTVDPLAGSYYVEHLTHTLEAEAMKLIKLIDEMGGSVAAVEAGWMQEQIARSSYEAQKSIESGEQIVVGLNAFASNETESMPSFKINDSIRVQQSEKIAHLRATRNDEIFSSAIKNLDEACTTENNLMPHILGCVEAYATLGEIADILRNRFGEYQG
ncbi:MAG: methylmalonyl-CoA mutase family protein [Bacteroidetes bacterium]|nr:methylmalonyl-CoA mutase family protein [Bacteroidota bacterium]MDA1224827.1 methylmalonyl-CoA mutase family protein [Bacteroidota bacterium]